MSFWEVLLCNRLDFCVQKKETVAKRVPQMAATRRSRVDSVSRFLLSPMESSGLVYMSQGSLQTGGLFLPFSHSAQYDAGIAFCDLARCILSSNEVQRKVIMCTSNCCQPLNKEQLAKCFSYQL